MTPAARLQRHLKRRTTEAGGMYRKLQWTARRGAPDCLISFGFPRVALVEVKAGADVLSTGQSREITRLKADGWPVWTARDEADIDRIVLEVKGDRS